MTDIRDNPPPLPEPDFEVSSAYRLRIHSVPRIRQIEAAAFARGVAAGQAEIDELRAKLKALMKLKAAQTAHPRAVTVLIEEAHDLLEIAFAANAPEPQAHASTDAMRKALHALTNGADVWEAMRVLREAIGGGDGEPEAQPASIGVNDLLKPAPQNTVTGLTFDPNSASKPERTAICHETELPCTYCPTNRIPCEASKPEPQAQAGEPPVVAVFKSDDDCGHVELVPFQSKRLLKDGDELITLQAHRKAMANLYQSNSEYAGLVSEMSEALAKKDAALKACVEARKGIAVAGHLPGPHRVSCAIHDPVPDRCDCGANTRHPVVLLSSLRPLDAAIKQAQEAQR